MKTTVAMKPLLKHAQRLKYGIGAFGVENAEMVKAIARAAAETKSPLVFQTTPSTLRYLEPEYFVGIVNTAVAEYGITAALHLDHGDSFELVKRCVDAGYTSVMIDGSKLDFDKNIELTSRVVGYASFYGVTVEAELGKVGGKEDDLSSVNEYTEPSEAAEFVSRTGIDALAIAFGTMHGPYKISPVLNLELIKKIRGLVNVPLVMHGSSGLEDEVFTTAIEYGICKINLATELRQAVTKGVVDVIRSNPRVIDPKEYMKKGAELLTEIVKKRILLMKSDKKTPFDGIL